MAPTTQDGFETLKQKILRLRQAGKVQVDVITRSNQDINHVLLKLLERVDGLEKTADEVMGNLKEIPKETGQQIIEIILNRDMAYGVEIMDKEASSTLAREFISLFGDHVSLYSNESEDFIPFHKKETSSYGSNSITNATFNTGVFVVGTILAGFILTEDED